MPKSGKQTKTWKVKRESCEVNPSEPHCTDPNNPSKLAKMSTLKVRIFKFYGICHKTTNSPSSGCLAETPCVFVPLEHPLTSLLWVSFDLLHTEIVWDHVL